MAFKLNGTSQSLTRSSGVPLWAAFSALCWCKPTTLGNSWRPVISFGNSSSSTIVGSVGQHNTGGSGAWSTFSEATTLDSAFATAAAVNEFFCVALTCDAADIRGYSRRAGNETFETSSQSSGSGTANALRFGQSAFDGTDWFAGSIWGVKVWDRVLNASELYVESRSREPVVTRNLHLWWPLDTASDARDYSGNGRHATVNASPTTDEIPAYQGFRKRRTFMIPIVVAAGTTRGTPFGNRGTAFNGGRTFIGPIAN